MKHGWDWVGRLGKYRAAYGANNDYDENYKNDDDNDENGD